MTLTYLEIVLPIRSSCYLLFFWLLCIAPWTLSAQEPGSLRVRAITSYVEAIAGQEATFEIEVANFSAQPLTLVEHLVFPTNGWQVIPSNDRLIHLAPGQIVLDTLVVQVPQGQSPGPVDLQIQVWSFENRNIYDEDTLTFLVQPSTPFSPAEPTTSHPAFVTPVEPEPPPQEVQKPGIALSFSTPPSTLPHDNTLLLLSALVKNTGRSVLEDTLKVRLPEGWEVIPSSEVAVKIRPRNEFLHLFAIKRPLEIPAGTYYLALECAGARSAPFAVEIAPWEQVKVQIEEPKKGYDLTSAVHLTLSCENLGNTPLKLRFEAVADPACSLLFPEGQEVELAPFSRATKTLRLDPMLTRDDKRQFLRFRAVNMASSQTIYEDSFALTALEHVPRDDGALIIPSHVAFMALGDNDDNILAIEIAGRGCIDPEKERSLEYVFRIPSHQDNVIYSIDQRLFVGIKDPSWDLNLGDTVYRLSPLTQRIRYGRGAGVDIHKNQVLLGTHYTQNTFSNSYDPKETGAYIGHRLHEGTALLQANYLHREVQREPISNLVSISSECELGKKIHAELEAGKNFAEGIGSDDPYAYRAQVRGRFLPDGWFDLEKIYAGAAFYGYYNNQSTLSGTVDTAVGRSSRFALSALSYKQDIFYESSADVGENKLCPRQHQYSATLSHQFLNGSSLSVNGLILQGRDDTELRRYDFRQRWIGATATWRAHRWNLLATASFGKEKDYLKRDDGKEPDWIQRYYVFANKQLTQRLQLGLSYEKGNTNYYDAKVWNSSISGSLGYRYARNSHARIFIQRVSSDKREYEFNQASLSWSHYLKNLHKIHLSVQRFDYYKRIPDDSLFLVSYTIPFGLPVHRHKNSGWVEGYVQDIDDDIPVRDALFSLAGKTVKTDSTGHFLAKNIPSGSHELNPAILPKQLISPTLGPQKVVVESKKRSEILIPLVHSASLTGELVYKETPPGHHEDLITTQPLVGVRIILERNQGEEIYTTLSDENGRFQFSHLRPGEWKLEVIKHGLPKMSQVEFAKNNFSLLAGENKQISIHVVPTKRTVLPIDFD